MIRQIMLFLSKRSLYTLTRVLLFLSFGLASTTGNAQSLEKARQTYAGLPQDFEPNRGQADPRVNFISRGPGYAFFLTPNEVDLQLIAAAAKRPVQNKRNTLRIKFLGANSRSQAEGLDPQTGRSNYLIGNNPDLWRTDVPHFGRVEYRDVYPGIGVEYHGYQRQLEYDFVIGPHADPRRIRLAIQGADQIDIDEEGDLVLAIGSAKVVQKRPVVYQDTRSGRVRVDGRYVIRGRNHVGFEVAAYDTSRPLVIDPLLIYSTYFGGNGADIGVGIKLDQAGNIYICGQTGSTNFLGIPVPGTPSGQPLNGTGNAAFVAKLSSAGALIFSTYIGGTNDSAFGAGVAVDGNGNVYVAGSTTAADFPTKSAIQPVYQGSTDAFVLELNSSGSALLYSTYLGGSALDFAETMEVDANGNAYVTGATSSTNFPTLNAMQPAYGGGGEDAFAAKIAPGGSSLVYSTYIGGSSGDFSNGLTLDSSGNLYVFGDTASLNFPLANPFQSVYGGGGADGWVTKLGPTGNMIYSTYFGGSAGDSVRGAKVDPSGNLHIAGNTSSSDLPIRNAIQPGYGGGANDAWVAALDPMGSVLLYSTYIGGSGDDTAYDLELDALGNIYIDGSTSSNNFPTLNAIQNNNAGGYDAFLTKINAAGSALLFSTYLGGSGNDSAWHVTVDSAERAYIIGTTASSNFPTVAPLQGTFGGGSKDAFLAIIETCDFTLTPPNATFASTGGAANVSIATTPECGWTATSNTPWITITSGTSGAGSGSISYNVAANTQGQDLTGGITIGDQAFPIMEFGGSVTLASVSPNSGAEGMNVPVMLTGTNFAANSSVNVSGSGITASNVSVVSATQITATLGIAANATVGPYAITVTSAGGTSNGVTFTVNSLAPVLTSISPSSGGAGNSVPVTLTGTNFIVGASLTSSNSSLSFSNVTVVSGTQITATVSMAANATPGSAPIQVSTSNGISNALGFTIQPLFTTIRVDAGSSSAYTDPLGQVWSADTGFTGGGLYTYNHAINGTPAPVLYQSLHYSFSTLTYQAAVPNGVYTVNLKFEEPQFVQSGKRISNVFINGQEVLANFDEFAVAGAQYQAVDEPIPVTVTNGSIAIQFVPVVNATGVYGIEILAGTPPAPTTTAITPNTGSVGAAVPVTITGTNLASDVVINAGPNITVNNITVVSATQLTATFNISATAPTGPANVKVTTSGGATAPSPFTIASAPTLVSVNPNSGVQGTNVPVTIAGTNFAANSSVNVSGGGITASNVSVVSATQITATLVIAANATVGPYAVTVTSAGVTSNGVTFTVSAAPTLASINPNSGAEGMNVPVTLTGANFAANSSVNVSGSGITVSNVSVVSATQITATLGIAANATVGPYAITVTSAGGTSNGVTFTVNSLAPVLTSISPSSGGAGNSVPVTLTGTNFIAGASLTSSNSSLGFSNVTVVSGTQITATVSMAANATPGSAPIQVTTSNGISNALGFTIQPLFTTIRVDAGSSSVYTDPLGQVWSADTGFTGGGLYSYNHAINGTPAPVLYQTVHYSFSTLTYQAAVPNGVYTVNLKFEEPQFVQSGKRISNVFINGQEVLANFDEFAAAGAQYQAVDVPIPVTVTNGSIAIQFVPVVNATGVYGIEILAGTPPAPTITAITPNAGSVGTAVPVTITGTNLASDVVINAGPNITVNNIKVVSATQVTATFNISPTASAGQANVTITTPGGTSASSLFTIPPPPLSVSITPVRGGAVIGQSVSFTATVISDVGAAGVTWTTSGGSFSSQNTTSATLIAPNTTGNVTVTATSVAQGTMSASATIAITDLPAVATHHNDLARDGANTHEFALTPANVNTNMFGKLFSCTADAAIYAQPLWIANLFIGGAPHNVVFVATERDSVYAFDADANPCVTYWKTGAGGVNSLLPSGETWVTSSDLSCNDLAPDIGITGTPVIDPGTNTIYVLTKSKVSATGTMHQRLHALDLATGAEKFGGPTEIQATVLGNGDGSSGNPPTVSFDPHFNGQRPALLLENVHIVIAWASHCDISPYHGWVMSYSASTLAQEAVFNTSPNNGGLSGIWMSGSGAAADSNGNIYFATGNGAWDGKTDFGDSIVKLGPPSGGSFTAANFDYFTPFNQSSLSNVDEDLGSGGLLLLPDLPSGPNPRLLVQAGKEGRIYLISRDTGRMGEFCPSCSNDTQIVQELPGAVGGMWGSPAYWNGNLYFGGSGDNLKAFSFSAGSLITGPTSRSATAFSFPGTTPSVSANGSQNAIVWVIDTHNCGALSNCSSGGPAILHAYDATNLASEFWNSMQGSGNTAGIAVKFTVPTIANGKVYIGTRGNDGGAGTPTILGELDVYGLKPN